MKLTPLLRPLLSLCEASFRVAWKCSLYSPPYRLTLPLSDQSQPEPEVEGVWILEIKPPDAVEAPGLRFEHCDLDRVCLNLFNELHLAAEHASTADVANLARGLQNDPTLRRSLINDKLWEAEVDGWLYRLSLENLGPLYAAVPAAGV